VPTSIWWTEDASAMEPLRALVSMGRQLVYDSRQWSDVAKGIRAICAVADERTDLSDLNWRRLAPVRRAVVHACSTTPNPTRSSIRIDHVPGERALAWLLAGWLASQCESGTADSGWPSIHQSPPDAEERIAASIGSDSSRVTLAMNDHRVRVTVSDAPPFVLAVPRDEDADAIAAELRTLARDAALRATMDFLASRANG
jgi:glucose-6-phosphate dehydrogenase assembly protein OpcA